MRRISLLILVASLSLAACRGKGEGSAAGDGTAPGGSGSAAAPAPPQPDPGLTVTAKGPTVGDKSESKESSEAQLELSMKVGAKTREAKIGMAETTVKRTEVLAVDGKAVTKAKVTYVEKKKSETMDGKDRRRPKNPLDGKTYVLEMKSGKVEITDEKGKKVSKREEDAVRRGHGTFGKPDPLVAAMPDKPMEVGKKVDALAAAVLELVNAHDDGKEKLDASDAEVTLTSIEGAGPEAIGVFAVKLTLSTPAKERKGFTMKAPVEGTLKIRAKDGWSTALDLSGPVEIGSPDPKKNLSGKGSLKLAYQITY